MKSQGRRNYLAGAGVTLVALFIWFSPPGMLGDLELLYQKTQFRWRGPEPAGPEVVIAAVDEKSLDQLGRWPWPRNVFARIVDNLSAMGARVIAFDMVFSSEDESGGREGLLDLKNELNDQGVRDPAVLSLVENSLEAADRDRILADSIRQSRAVVLGYFFHFTPAGLNHLSRQELDLQFQNIRPARFRGFVKSDKSIDLGGLDLLQAFAVESNLKVLSEATRHAGFFSFDVEEDGTLRRQPLLVRYHDAGSDRYFFFPSLAAKALEKFLKGTLLFKINPLGVDKVLIDSREPVVIPTNAQGEILINFLGPQGSFPYLSLADVYSPENSGLDPKQVRDKIVLVGATATALKDIRMTPFDPVFPGVEIHATIIDNILHGTSLFRPAWLDLAEPVILAFWGMILTAAFSRFHPLGCLGIWAAANLGYFSLVQWFFINERFFLFGSLPALQSLGILSFILANRYLGEQLQKRLIRNVFNQYVSPEVIDRLIASPDNLKLGGEQKELTAYFTDLAGFTTFSEKMTAEDQVSLLNEYLGEMTDILLKHEGTLDKYDGDAIKAFFGAPVYFENHAEKACRVALEMQEKLAALRGQWKERGLPELKMRIGINTGMMVVGNLGSRTRMNYGMNGDAVNLAARLEGANKFYGTFSMISESTYNQARDAIEAREMDVIQVVGRKGSVKIFELMSLKGKLPEREKNLIEIYQQGLQSYKKGDWSQAIQAFERCIELNPDDGPSRVLLKRCQELRQSPPENWEGVYTLSSK